MYSLAQKRLAEIWLFLFLTATQWVRNKLNFADIPWLRRETPFIAHVPIAFLRFCIISEHSEFNDCFEYFSISFPRCEKFLAKHPSAVASPASREISLTSPQLYATQMHHTHEFIVPSSFLSSSSSPSPLARNSAAEFLPLPILIFPCYPSHVKSTSSGGYRQISRRGLLLAV